MNAYEILTKAAELVTGDRAATHGRVEDTYGLTATLWSAFLQHRCTVNGLHLEDHDVLQMLALMKIARAEFGKFNADDYVDTAGYAALAGQRAHYYSVRR